MRCLKEIPCQTVFLLYCVPFYFDAKKEEAIVNAFSTIELTKFNGKTESLWSACAYPLTEKEKQALNPDIFEHVQALMGVVDSPQRICRTWKYNMSDLSFADQDCHVMTFRGVTTETDKAGEKKRLLELPFKIADVYVHVFSTGIGFFTYQIAPEGVNDIDSLADFQCQVKELSHRNKSVRYEQLIARVPFAQASSLEEAEKGRLPKGKASASIVNEKAKMWEIRAVEEFRLGEWIRDILNRTYEGFTFFASSGDRLPDKAVLMSYGAYDCEDQKELQYTACHMAQGYDAKYHISETTLAQCYELFDNVYCFASFEGCAVAVKPMPENGPFFLQNSPRLIYAFIFILTLYQHYSLLRFTARIAQELPSSAQVYLNDASNAERMTSLIAEINAHLMKSDIATISNIRQHNIFYSVCQDALRIADDRWSLGSGFEYLVNIQRDMQQALRAAEKQKEREERQREKEAADEARRIEQVERERERNKAEDARRIEQEERQRERDIQEEKDARLGWLLNLIAIITFLGDGFGLVQTFCDILQKMKNKGVEIWDMMKVLIYIVILIVVFVAYRWHRRKTQKREKSK